MTTGPPGVTHRGRILNAGGHIEVEINDRVVLKWDDPGVPHGAGRIGFRSMKGVTTIEYDNLKIWSVSK
jgi:hypothetical protein